MVATSTHHDPAAVALAHREAFAMITEAVLVADQHGRCIDANNAAVALLRYEPSELLGRSVHELVIADEGAAPAEVFLPPEPWDGIVDLRRGDGTIVRVRAHARTVDGADHSPVAVAVLWPAHDAAGSLQLESAAERVQISLELTAALSTATTPEAIGGVLLQRILRAAGGIAGVAALVSADGDTVEVVAREGLSGLDDQAWRRFPLDAALPLSDAIRERRAVVLGTLAARDARYPALVGAGFMFDHAMACIPMLTGGRAVGGIAVSFAGARTLAQDELAFLVALAAQGALASERARLRQAEHAQRERSAFVATAGQLLAASLDYERTLAEVARLAVHGVVIEDDRLAGPADWCAVDLLDEDGAIRLLAVEHLDPRKVQLAHDLRRRIPPSPEDAAGVGAVIRTGRPEVTTEVSDAVIAAAVEDPEVRQILFDLKLTSSIVVPLISRGRVLGALSLVASGSGRHYGAEDLDLAQDIARLAAAAIDNARLYRERDHIARTLQQVLMPSSLPRIPGFDCAASYTPGRSGMEVGGDFYDVFVRPDGSFGIVIGDVSGKGAEAAAIMGLARQSVRAIGLWTSRPSEILGTLNQALLLAEHVDRFVTVCDARVRPDDGGATVTSCSAGHPLPVVVRGNGEVGPVGEPGQLLGVFDEVSLHDATIHLDAGDAVVFYTDGVTEWGLGSDRTDELQTVLRQARGRSAAEILEAVQLWWRAGAGAEPRDDAALLVVRRSPPDPDPA